MMIPARFVSLDSSHWAGLCASLIEKPSRADATRRLRGLANNGWIPAISFHQLSELLAHENERTAIARLSALRHVQTLASVVGSTDDNVPGTVVDVQRLEIIAATDDPDADAEVVRAKVRRAFLKMTTGDAIVEAMMPIAHPVRAQILARQEHKRETASISQAVVLDQSRMPFDLNGTARSPAAAKAHLATLTANLSEELARRGDRRLTDPHASATTFIDSLNEHWSAIATSPQPVAEILKAAGLTVEDVANLNTIGQVGELAHFRRNIEISAAGTAISKTNLQNLSQDRVPTWRIHRALLRHRQVRPHVEGGDLTDSHLLSLAPYFDAISVDKRTAEDIRRIRQHDSAAGQWLMNVRKASSWMKAFDQFAGSKSAQ